MTRKLPPLKMGGRKEERVGQWWDAWDGGGPKQPNLTNSEVFPMPTPSHLSIVLHVAILCPFS